MRILRGLQVTLNVIVSVLVRDRYTAEEAM